MASRLLRQKHKTTTNWREVVKMIVHVHNDSNCIYE